MSVKPEILHPTGESPPTPQQGHSPGEIERVFREHNESLLRFIAAKLGSKQEAHEVAQEAYVRLLSLDHHQAVSFLRAYLFKVAANLATDRLRLRSRRGFLSGDRELDHAVFELSPERQVESEQSLDVFRAAIEELPAKCRDAFLLYRLEGLGVQDVASRMGIQERMVLRYVARALEYIRERVYGQDRRS